VLDVCEGVQREDRDADRGGVTEVVWGCSFFGALGSGGVQTGRVWWCERGDLRAAVAYG